MKKTEENENRIERKALVKEIERQIRELTVEQLRRVDWYIERITR